jgi:hypothetical protein
MTQRSRLALFCSAAMVAAALLTGCGPSEPKVEGAAPEMRRLTPEQYANIIADVFGEQITVFGRFDPIPRTDGLTALGARSASITPAGFEQFDELARSIAAQVVSPANRADLVPCTPEQPGVDDACARSFFTHVGRLLYRRPLTEQELATPVTAARNFGALNGDFYDGLAAGLAGMMTTPQFLFVADATEPDPDHPGMVRLTGHAKAARLSFLLWNTAPDDVLLTAAEKGELHSRDGIARQADRMLNSPRLDRAVRAFFKDFLDFEKFETVEKDPVIYPAYAPLVSEDAQEQMLRTIIDHTVTRNGDYRGLFTTNKTFMTPALARLYQVPTGRPDGGWTPHEFAENDPRSGLITQIGFLAMHAHPGRSSPTLRGRAVRELLLCQKVPDPPGDVDFSLFNDPNSPNKTARDRLSAHSTAAACSGCHKVTDPIGLGLEHFDGAGEYRPIENGVNIDTSGDLDGKAYTDARGLAKAIHDSPAATSCLVNRLTAYALGRPLDRRENTYVSYLAEGFERSGYKLPALMRAIATSETLYAVTAPAPKAAAGRGPRSQENES